MLEEGELTDKCSIEFVTQHGKRIVALDHLIDLEASKTLPFQRQLNWNNL